MKNNNYAELGDTLTGEQETLLRELISAHSTPMDESEVAEILKSNWKNSNLAVAEIGKYAICAEYAPSEKGKNDVPIVLVCAHMDSPGYIVESISENRITLVSLGGAAFDEPEIEIVVKTSSGKYPVRIRASEEENNYMSETVPPDVRVGDRGCFPPDITIENNIITAPFLDNRLGCFILTLLGADREFMQKENLRIVLAATASEEMGGFGAPVLARYIKADFVIVLDATYTSDHQGIRMGEGGVFTLSDNSVILSPHERDELASLFDCVGVPYQFEVYNYSGTDAKAFPATGFPAPVRALLVPTENNHHHNEVAAVDDIIHTCRGVKVMVDALDK